MAENINYSATPDGGHEAVLHLFIDDGNKSRGHRKNIFNPNSNFIGVGVASHPTYKQCVVCDYTGGLGNVDSDDHIEVDESLIPKREPAEPIADDDNDNNFGDDNDGNYSYKFSSMDDVPPEFRSQIKAMDFGGDFGFPSGGCSGFGQDDGDDDDPSGYTSKSTQMQTKTVNGKTTKIVTTTYGFPDGSTQTVTKTESY